MTVTFRATILPGNSCVNISHWLRTLLATNCSRTDTHSLVSGALDHLGAMLWAALQRLPLFRPSLLYSLPPSLRVAPALSPSSLQRVCLFQLSPAQVVTPGFAGIWAKGVTRSVLESEIIPKKCELSQTQTEFLRPGVCLPLTTFLLLGVRKTWTQTGLCRVSLGELVPVPEISQWFDLHSHVFWWKVSLVFYSCVLPLPRLASAEVCFPFGAKSQQVLQAGCQTGSYSGRVNQFSKQCCVLKLNRFLEGDRAVGSVSLSCYRLWDPPALLPPPWRLLGSCWTLPVISGMSSAAPGVTRI